MLRVESKQFLARRIGTLVGLLLGIALLILLPFVPGALVIVSGGSLGALLGRWFFPNFTVFGGGETPVARADLSKWLWHGTTKLEIGGTRYEAHIKGRSGKEYISETEYGRVAAVAEKPSVWSNRFVLEHNDNRYELKRSFLSRTFVLSREGVDQVGSVRIRPEMIVDLPEDLPLEMRVFIAWLFMAVLITGIPMNTSLGLGQGIGAAIGVVLGGLVGSIAFGGTVGFLALIGYVVGMALGASLAESLFGKGEG
jgi:hypothetical protein